MEEVKTEVQPGVSVAVTTKKEETKVSLVVVAAVALVFLLIGIGVGYFWASRRLAAVAPGVVCTLEAKICADGSSVGRTAPGCEFAPCPEEVMNGGLPAETTTPGPVEGVPGGEVTAP